MMTIKDKRDCCGCSACAQICPRQCITMREDEEGFLYPDVNQELCVNCGLCEACCPMLNAPASKSAIQSVYASYVDDDTIRLQSSSGGLFPVLAKSVLAEGGAVIGAAFDQNFGVHHVTVDSIEQLADLQGSKYLQSRIEHTFQDAKQQLEKGKKVLFSGTGCQIAGLKRYLRKDYQNLLTVDVLCHGVPSPRVWRLYLDEQERAHGAAVRRTFFRQKRRGWKTYALSLEFSNDKAYERIYKEDPFMQMFLKNVCLRPSCYHCKYKAINSQADITLGDCWGINKTMPEMDDDKGCSLVLIHTPKGAQAFDCIGSQLVTAEAELGRISQPMIDKSADEHPRREKFFTAVNNEKPTEELMKITKPTLWERAKRKVKHILENY